MRVTQIAAKDITYPSGMLFKVTSLHHNHSNGEYLIIDAYPSLGSIPPKIEVYDLVTWKHAKDMYVESR